MTFLNINKDYKQQSINSGASPLYKVQPGRDYNSKNGAMWDCIGSTPTAKGKGEIYEFKLKAAYNPLLNPNANSAPREIHDKIFPALEFAPEFTSFTSQSGPKSLS